MGTAAMTVQKHSSIVILFNHDLTKVATGYSVTGNVRRFIGDHFDLCTNKFSDEKRLSREYAQRTLAIKFGIRDQDLVTLSRLEYVRQRHLPNMVGRSSLSNQHFFIAVAAPTVIIPQRIGREIHSCKFVDVSVVLQSWQLDRGSHKSAKRESHEPESFGNPNRTNPHHVKGLVKALLVMKENFYGDAHMSSFTNMIDELESCGVNLHTYFAEIVSAVAQWKK